MSAIIGNLPAPKVVDVTQSETGVGELSISIPMSMDISAGFSYPAPTSIPLIPGYSFVKARGKKNVSGAWDWVLTYQGQSLIGQSPTPGADDLATYSFDPTDLQIDIKANPQFESWVKQYNGQPDPKDPTHTIFSQSSSANSQNTVSGPLAAAITDLNAAEDYFSFGGTWMKNYSTSGVIPASAFANVESIVATVPQPSWMTLPSFGSRTWLKRMPVMRAKGRSVEITEKYTLSGLGGWNPLIYSGKTQ